MNIPWRAIIWQQFGAAIDTLDDMIRACPDDLWRERLWESPSTRPEYAEFWYRVDHALFWLDLYLTGAEEGFSPPAPFELIEMEEDDLPERVYTKDELHAYLSDCRKRCQMTIESMTDEAALRRCQFAWGKQFHYQALAVFIQIINHGVEHRTNITTILIQGLQTPPKVDGWGYLEAHPDRFELK